MGILTNDGHGRGGRKKNLLQMGTRKKFQLQMDADA